MKKFYSNPFAEFLYLDSKDVITISDLGDENPDGDDDSGGWGEIFPVDDARKRR